MAIGPPDCDGRRPWRSIPSVIDEAMLLDHENLLDCRLPPLFRAYLMGSCLLITDFYVGQLPPICPVAPMRRVEFDSVDLMDTPFFLPRPWLVPFAAGAADMSNLCFDTRRPTPLGDYPVIQVHHLAGYFNGHRDAPPFVEERCQIFGSFANYLDYLEAWILFSEGPRDGQFEQWLLKTGRVVPRPYHHRLD